MNRTFPPRLDRLGPEAGFVLLEVVVSLAILSLALTMVMRSLTISMRAARQSANITFATMLARSLIEQWELAAPPEGEFGDDFAPEHPNFSFRGNYSKQEPEYEDFSDLGSVGRLAYLRRISLDIYFTPGGEDAHTKRILHVETALTYGEKFNSPARLHNEIGFED